MIYTVTLNPAIDRIVHIPGELTRGQNHRSTATSFDIGGKATHVSVVLSSLNIANIATGFMGEGRKDVLIDLLEKKGVCHDFLTLPNEEVRESIVIVDETNKGSYMITEKGPNVSPNMLQQFKEKLQTTIQKNDIVVFAGNPSTQMDPKDYRELLEMIKSKHCRLVVDASDRYLQEALAVKPYLLKPNQYEFKELIGKPLNTLEDYIHAAFHFMCDDIEYFFISLGKEGSLLLHHQEIYHIIPPTVKQVNDTGCGDVFIGGLVYSIAQKFSVEKMCRFATAISASKATQHSSSDFELEQVQALMEKVKVNQL